MVVVEVGHCYCSVRSQKGNVVDPRHRIRRSKTVVAEKEVAHVPGWYYYWIDSCWPDDGLHRAISGCHVDLKGLGAVIPYCLVVVVVEKRMMVCCEKTAHQKQSEAMGTVGLMVALLCQSFK